jgi:hypothetical protein
MFYAIRFEFKQKYTYFVRIKIPPNNARVRN